MFEVIKGIHQLEVHRQTVPNYWCQVRQICFDQKACFLKDVLVSKKYILYMPDLDQIVYIYHANIEDKFA